MDSSHYSDNNPVNKRGWTPVADLFARYKLAKSVVYKRVKDLGIKSERVGMRTYITKEQLALLDALHEFIQGGGTTAEFLFFRGEDDEDKP